MSNDTSLDPHYLYLTTTGRKTGKPHTIEIWFVELEGNYYCVSERPEKADWVRNIVHSAAVTVRIGDPDAVEVACTARQIYRSSEPDLSAKVAALMNAKYNWSDGQIVQLSPQPIPPEPPKS